MTYNGDDIPYLGMWAELRKNYLLEEKPEDYAELVEEKMVIEYFVAIEERYSNVGLSKICYKRAEKTCCGDLKAKGRIGRALENSFQLASFCRKSSKETNLLRA